ncbi:MAG: copper resistance protein CopC [Dermatophilaceae bacterium]|nr:copper resistance protein CopC [Intrasporangiaceae bacterium]
MSRSNPRLRTVATVIVALLLVAGLIAPAAFAHAQLLGSDPADGATLATTDQVVLTFNEDINPDFVQVVVTGPDGVIPTDEATVEGGVLTQALTPTSSGEYSLAYRVVSADGHPISGRIGFTLTDVPGSAASTTTAGSTVEAPTTPEQPTVMSGDEVAAAEAVDPQESGTTLSPLVLLLGALALAALAGAGAWLARQRRHPEH